MTEFERAKKRHCWPKQTLSDAYEAGFENGVSAAFERALAFLNAESLFLAIGHGDAEHQRWLKEHLNQWFQTKFALASEGQHMPTPTTNEESEKDERV